MDKIDAEKSLGEIKKHLRETEKERRKAGIYAVDIQLLMGVLVLLGLGVTVLFERLTLYKLILIGWIVVILLGWFFGYRISKRISEAAGFTSFAGRLIEKVWLGIAICLTLNMIIGWFSKGRAFSLVSIPMFVGIGFFVEAFVSWKEFLIAAVLYWLGAIIVGLYPEISIFVFVFLVFVTNIIPGIVVRIRFRGKEI
jgi:hypothetical protein